MITRSDLKTFLLSTIAIPATAAVFLALVIAILGGSAAVAFSQEPLSNAGDHGLQTVSGVLTDAHCGARHPSDSGLSAGDCARICVKKGSPWALVDGEKVYTIKGDSPYYDKLSGQRIQLTGTLEGDAIAVKSITSNGQEFPVNR